MYCIHIKNVHDLKVIDGIIKNKPYFEQKERFIDGNFFKTVWTIPNGSYKP